MLSAGPMFLMSSFIRSFQSNLESKVIPRHLVWVTIGMGKLLDARVVLRGL